MYTAVGERQHLIITPDELMRFYDLPTIALCGTIFTRNPDLSSDTPKCSVCNERYEAWLAM